MELIALEVVFILPAEQADIIDSELRDSNLLNDWPVVRWVQRPTKTWEDKWYEEEYLDEMEYIDE